MAVWHRLKPKQLRAVGVAQLIETSIYQREFCELTTCPRAEQIPCICIELTGYRPCLSVVCLWYVSGIVSLSLHLSSCMGFFGLVLVMFFCNQDQYLMQNICLGFVLRAWLFNTKIFVWWLPCVDMVLLEFPFTGFIEKCC